MASTALAVLLGCSVEDPKLADELTPLMFVPQMLFAGFFVTPDLIPVWLRWARYLCTLTYAVRIALATEFKECAKTNFGCQKVLEDAEADGDDLWWSWLVLIVLFAFFRLSALCASQKSDQVLLNAPEPCQSWTMDHGPQIVRAVAVHGSV